MEKNKENIYGVLKALSTNSKVYNGKWHAVIGSTKEKVDFFYSMAEGYLKKLQSSKSGSKEYLNFAQREDTFYCILEVLLKFEFNGKLNVLKFDRSISRTLMNNFICENKILNPEKYQSKNSAEQGMDK